MDAFVSLREGKGSEEVDWAGSNGSKSTYMHTTSNRSDDLAPLRLLWQVESKLSISEAFLIYLPKNPTLLQDTLAVPLSTLSDISILSAHPPPTLFIDGVLWVAHRRPMRR